jgi:hypothetical protein
VEGLDLEGLNLRVDDGHGDPFELMDELQKRRRLGSKSGLSNEPK